MRARRFSDSNSRSIILNSNLCTRSESEEKANVVFTLGAEISPAFHQQWRVIKRAQFLGSKVARNTSSLCTL